MTNLSVVNDRFVMRSCCMKETSVETDDSSLEEMGERIGLLIDHMGMQNAVEVAGKSDRQLKRYSAGAEPPFGVLKALIDSSDASFDWLASGRARTRVDHELSLLRHKRKLPELERELLTDLSDEDRSDLEELLAITRHLIVLEEELLKADVGQAQPIGSPTDLDQPGMIAIPRYDEVRPSAGHGSVAISEIPTTRVAFERHWLIDIGVQPNAAVILPAQGDSMSPTIPNGAPMLVDTSKREVRNGFIYVFDIDGDLVVKRIERLPDGTFDLISDNRNYPTRNLSRSTVTSMTVIGRVYAAVSKF